MNPTYLLRLAALGLLAKKIRSILTLSGIAISVGVIIFMISLSTGLQNVVTQEMSRSQSTKVITVSSQKTTKLKITNDYISKFQSTTGVSSVDKVLNLSGRIIYHSTSLGIPVYGVSGSYFDAVPVKFISGAPFVYDKKNPKKMVIVNRVVLDALSIKDVDEAFGKLVNVDFILTRDFAPSIVESSKTSSDNDYVIAGVTDDEDTPIMYVPVEIIEKLGAENFSQAKVAVNSTGEIESARKEIEQMGFQTANIRDTIAQVNKIFYFIKILLGVFGLITLVVAVLGTLNTITITLVEQTREIGFLRLIGIKRSDVSNLFTTQSILIALIGSISGIILGYIFAALANLGVHVLASRTNLMASRICTVPIWVVIVLILSALLVGYLVGLAPSKRAVGISPLKAMRD